MLKWCASLSYGAMLNMRHNAFVVIKAVCVPKTCPRLPILKYFVKIPDVATES